MSETQSKQTQHLDKIDVPYRHAYERATRNIPDENKPDFVKVAQRFNPIQYSRGDLEYIFKMYNRFIAIAGREEDIKCGNCRAKVALFARKIANWWVEFGVVNLD